MKSNGRLYLGGYTPSLDHGEFVWVSAEQIKPDILYYITEVGEFERYDYGDICILYSFKDTGLLDDSMSDFEPNIDIYPVMGHVIIDMDNDTLNTFEDVYDILRAAELADEIKRKEG